MLALKFKRKNLWKNVADFDLEKWRAKLDEQGLKIGDNQENSLKNRRKLAESTRGEHIFVSITQATPPLSSRLCKVWSYGFYLIQLKLELDFKKASNDEKAKAFPALLKGYQEEVDNLTKRAKFGENAFLNIYQKLYEAPDPVPALSTGSVSISHLHFFMSDMIGKGLTMYLGLN